ncbi:unnamed protein product [Paramecium primaurelia]|uniref:Probable threonine--tRNA ligase, cytoplasmic n=1 Tax=Paramecium primaurelia TaxID=5886 RepID=A0A8S1KGY4_PARPR|nr:unnamed protein product [Paramecium primaurelia]
MQQGSRLKEATEGTIQQFGNKIGGPFKIGKPVFQEKRLKLFQEIYQRQQAEMKMMQQTPIKITLKDGKQIEGKKWVTTPLQIAQGISKKMAESMVAAKVVYETIFEKSFVDVDHEETSSQASSTLSLKPDYLIWDLTRPLEGDCSLELLSFDDKNGQEVFWHSSAHILGSALEEIYGCHLCIGPAIEGGFFYDCYLGDIKVTQNDYVKIEKAAQDLVSAKQEFQRVILTKEECLEIFGSNPFKRQLITNKIPDGSLTTAYRCGNLIDLCTGPHLPNTSYVKAFQITKNSAAYWLGKNTNDDLQRVYGISFPNKKLLDEYVKIQKELAQRDHRNVGKKQNLYLFHQLSPGSAFFYPSGAHIYNTLMNFLRRQYYIRGYQEVISPNIFNAQLWKISGHYDKYKENLFFINMGEEGEYGLKPMNCPGHCLMFDMVQHSYRDLPIRFADFGVLHRNEVHGALTGLTRVRRFQQDDAHIFCRMDQIQDEIKNCLDFLSYIYSLFGFEFKLYLSTRPEKFLGTKDVWDNAEYQLEQGLKKFGKYFEINPGDGAFYGPKIDVKLYDAYKREHQCGTIQLDFNLPERFNLQYRASEDVHEVQQDKETVHNEQIQVAQEIIDIHRKESHQSDPGDGDLLSTPPRHTQQQGEQPGELKIQSSHSFQSDKVLEQQQQQYQQLQLQQHSHSASSLLHKKQKLPEELLESGSSQGLSNHELHKVLHEKKYELGYHHLKPGFARPVIVHRAILGSLERMIAVLTEQCGGKWPFWLSPKQLILCPVSAYYRDVAEKISARLRLEGYTVNTDESDQTLAKKVRNAQIQYYNFVGVIGEEEVRIGVIDIRDCEKNTRIGKLTIPQLCKFFESLKPPKSKVEIEIHEHDDTHLKLNDELQDKVFLDGDGFIVGPRDYEEFAKIKEIDPALQNLIRWQKHMTFLVKKDQQKQQQE